MRASSARALVAVCALVLASCSSGNKTADNVSPERTTGLHLISSANAENNDPPGPWDPQPGEELADLVQIRSVGGVLKAVLDVDSRLMYVSGSRLKVRNFNDELIGPTMHVRPGERIEVTFTNGMTEPTNIHYHGLHVSPLDLSDNVFRAFKPGATDASVVTLPPDHPLGTYWYHVHFHGISEGQVGGGLSGLLIVDGLEDRLPPAMHDITQRQLAIRDVRTVAGDNAIILDQTNYMKTDATTRLVNGQYEPKFSIREGETQLWRIANIGSDLFYDIALGDQTSGVLPFAVIAEDGNPVWEVWSQDHLPLPPGKRYDVLVQGGKPGDYNLGTLAIPGGPPPSNAVPLLAKLTVTPDGGRKPDPLPTTIATPDEKSHHDLSTATPDGTNREFAFSFGTGVALINNKEFNINRLDVPVGLGATEEWTLLNKTPMPHPFHIHVNPFQVMSINDVPYKARSLEDVVSVPPRFNCDGAKPPNCTPGKVVIRQRYEDFHGWFVFHCHILGHEDQGMMMNVQVLAPGDVEGPPPHDLVAHDAVMHA